MKNLFRLPAKFLALATVASAALTPTEWQHRQPLEVAAPGLVKVALSPATFDAAQAGLADLRVLDPEGREVASFLDREVTLAPAKPAPRGLRALSFVPHSSSDGLQLIIQPGIDGKIASIELETPAPFFLKAAHVETSDDGLEWKSVGPAEPVFRQLGVEQLSLNLGGRVAPLVRVTLDNLRTAPVAFTGARVIAVAGPVEPSRPVTAAHEVAITRREEFAGETVLTLALPGRHLPLAALSFTIDEPLFMRRVTLAARELQDTTSTERKLATGTLYRVALDGNTPRAQLDLPVDFASAERELLVHIHNGDSPPLKVVAVEARTYPVHLIFRAGSAGTYQLLSGNPQASAARYDLAAFANDLRTASGATIAPGPLTSIPDYHPSETLAPALPEIPLAGAPLDLKGWSTRRGIVIDHSGVQELELDPAALAGARPDQADLRVAQGGNQIPYVLERPPLARSLTLTPVSDPDKKRPSVSRWRVTLPQEKIPVQKLVLATKTPLFSRQFRISEIAKTAEGQSIEVTLGSGDWSRTPEPGVPETRTFAFSDRLRSDTIWIETDNGDNPPITLDAVAVTYPVVRLIFKTAATDGFTLAYGNDSVTAPRYDLGLVAARLLTAPRVVAKLGGAPAPEKPAFGGVANRYIFWGALALVVVALLVVVAKMLPKAPR